MTVGRETPVSAAICAFGYPCPASRMILARSASAAGMFRDPGPSVKKLI
jgi:hypothetical protein